MLGRCTSLGHMCHAMKCGMLYQCVWCGGVRHGDCYQVLDVLHWYALSVTACHCVSLRAIVLMRCRLYCRVAARKHAGLNGFLGVFLVANAHSPQCPPPTSPLPIAKSYKHVQELCLFMIGAGWIWYPFAPQVGSHRIHNILCAAHLFLHTQIGHRTHKITAYHKLCILRLIRVYQILQLCRLSVGQMKLL